MRIYDIGGRAYEWLILALTLGQEERFKRQAVARLGIRPGNHVLDWGCGTGLGTRLVLPHLRGRGRIHGIDLSSAMIRRARNRIRSSPELDVQFLVRTGFEARLPAPADAAMASYSLGVLPPEKFDAALREIWTNLKPDGRLLIVDMYVPPATTFFERTFQSLNRFVSVRVFHQDFSQTLLPAAERWFDRLEMRYHAGLMAFAFIGRRRETAGA